MVRYKVKISYDGTEFVGWQRQINGKSVQSVLEDSFFKLFKQKPFILAASRTDAGVHAREQVAIVDFENFGLSAQKLFSAWNTALPASIFIFQYELAPGFNPHVGVVFKEYEYLLLKKKNPFLHRFAWFYNLGYKIDWEAFFSFLNILSTHEDGLPKNYQDFYKKELNIEKNENMRINITFFSEDKDSIIKIKFVGKSFLRHQLRRIVGGAIQFAISGDKFSLKDVQKSLNGEMVFPGKIPVFTASAQGLCLKKIIYENK